LSGKIITLCIREESPSSWVLSNKLDEITIAI
jgi:hypothetical protein